jgi:hypothetical protein
MTDTRTYRTELEQPAPANPNRRKGRTTMSDERELVDAIAECVPYDGPHSADTVTDAARGLPALVRYLNNATGPGNARTTLKWAATVHRVLGDLGAAVYGLDQLLTQLAAASTHQASDPTLYDDRRDRPGEDTARALAAELGELRRTAGGLARSIDQARELSVHLGND